MTINKIKMNGLFLCFILTTLFMSCNKDDNNSQTLIGTWACVASSDDCTIAKYDMHYESHEGGGGWTVDYKHFSTYDTSITDFFKAKNVVFREDGYWDGNTSDRVGWWYDDYVNNYSYQTISYFYLLGDDYGSWCIIENKLYINAGDDEYVWDIKKFTKSELKISITYIGEDRYGNKYKHRHTRTFKKQS